MSRDDIARPRTHRLLAAARDDRHRRGSRNRSVRSLRGVDRRTSRPVHRGGAGDVAVHRLLALPHGLGPAGPHPPPDLAHGAEPRHDGPRPRWQRVVDRHARDDAARALGELPGNRPDLDDDVHRAGALLRLRSRDRPARHTAVRVHPGRPAHPPGARSGGTEPARLSPGQPHLPERPLGPAGGHLAPRDGLHGALRGQRHRLQPQAVPLAFPRRAAGSTASSSRGSSPTSSSHPSWWPSCSRGRARGDPGSSSS